MKKLIKVILIALLGPAICLTAEALAVAHRIHLKAESLIAEASGLKPNQEMEEVRKRWNREFDRSYVSYGENAFGVNIENSRISKWHLVAGALLSVNVHGESGIATDVNILYYGSNSDAPAGIMVHESLSAQSPIGSCRIRMQRASGDKPWRAHVDFDYSSRKLAMFGFRLSCLSSTNGCETPYALLPTLVDLQSSCITSQAG